MADDLSADIRYCGGERIKQCSVAVTERMAGGNGSRGWGKTCPQGLPRWILVRHANQLWLIPLPRKQRSNPKSGHPISK
ncbi:hypothetical protein RRG08_013158 [Elysia crispata]|uniref:Uncharacterized protein n=1 Tax=Elysia crispata TaxID=231223 RepID=A0AAE1A0C1_9GAST|nr:hypothetical protein RRG08_013158 [Elysia crispata]